MRIAFFDTHSYERAAFEKENASRGHEIVFLEPRLTPQTASLARGCPAVCSFVDDEVGADALRLLAAAEVRLLALRSAGYNHVDLLAAERAGIPVVRVPEYSPHAVAEHAVLLVLALDRKLCRAWSRVREWNFSLEGLVGFDLHRKRVGILGTGKIGRVAARIFVGFGCEVIAVDIAPDQLAAETIGFRYAKLDEMYETSDILSLHVPLTPQTHHMIDARALARMKRGALIVNTGRGALVDTPALVEALKNERIGGAALDVYEEEEGLFFRDFSDQVIKDDVLARLLTFPNVLITSHQAFLTHEALGGIAATTLESITAFERGEPLRMQVRAADVLRG
ncbi:MAG TPA: 2-hydroxyacid dehydrogenase [Polyangiaceae bacterium]|nr:2-hydroxyacid dehydrogenase [Polyangiaceae bacterium]